MSLDDEPRENMWANHPDVVVRDVARPLVLRLLLRLGVDPVTRIARQKLAMVDNNDTRPIGSIYTPEILRSEVAAALTRIIPNCDVQIRSNPMHSGTSFHFAITATVPDSSVTTDTQPTPHHQED